MASIKLKRIVFPGGAVNVLGQMVKTLETGERGKPVVTKLEYNPDERMVVAEIENKGTVLFPVEQIANLIPMDKEEEEYRVLTPEERLRKRVEETERNAVKFQEPPPSAPAPVGVSVEEAERIRAEFKAKQREKKEVFTADQADESLRRVIDPLFEDQPDEEPKEVPKPKPKKRGRPKKKRG